MPMPVKNARITNTYKDPLCKIHYSKGYHTGIDFVGESTIYAVLDATVLIVGFDSSGWGRYIILRTLDGKYDIIHAHLSSAAVKQGDRVSAGQTIGVMGTTGNSTGIHLHFEVRNAPWTNQDDIDPAVFLGIENERGTAVSIPAAAKPADKSGKNLILCNPGPDERAGGYLGDWLGCEVRLLRAAGDLGNVANIYVVGSQVKPVPGCVNIVGKDRYDTCRKVLELCR